MYFSDTGRRNDHDEHSPHYFVIENRKYPEARSSRREWREPGRLVQMALKVIAGYDSDHAHFADRRASPAHADEKVLHAMSSLIASTLPSQQLPVTVVDGSLVIEISGSSGRHFEPS